MMEPTRPKVRCRRCGTLAHWRLMVVKWEAEWMKCHLCPRCEALETDQSEVDVIEATFNKPMHKKIRVEPGTITSYYICLGRTRWELDATEPSKCRRLLPSKQWYKRKDDTQEEWVPQQKWYCRCSARYRTGWGQVVRMEESDGTVSYVRTDCASWDLEDSAGSVKELYDKIRSIEPSVNDIVGMDANGCKYIKKYEDFEAMPLFSWKELLTLARVFCKM